MGRKELLMSYRELFKSKAYKRCCAIVYSVIGDKCLRCQGTTYISYVIPINTRPAGCLDVFNMQPLCQACLKDSPGDYRSSDDIASLSDYLDHKDIKYKEFIKVIKPIPTRFTWDKAPNRIQVKRIKKAKRGYKWLKTVGKADKINDKDFDIANLLELQKNGDC